MNQKKIDAVWATDENYVFLTLVSMTSLFENNKEFEKIHVWILGDHISDLSKIRLNELASRYNRDISILNVSDYIHDIEKSGARKWGNSYAAYSRLFIAKILKAYNVHKIIYADCDLIFDGSIINLWNIDIGDKTIGLCKEYNRVEIRDLLNLPRNANYYQSGLLLMDIDKWCEKLCLERIIDHMQNVRARYPFVDQDLINCVLHDDIFVLPPQYNVNPLAMEMEWEELCYVFGLNEINYYSKEEFNNVLRNGNKPVIYHCSQPHEGRPWEEGNRNFFNDIWNKYYVISGVNNWYVKKKRINNKFNKSEYFMKTYFPRCIYLFIYRLSSKYFMQKKIKRDL